MQTGQLHFEVSALSEPYLHVLLAKYHMTACHY